MKRKGKSEDYGSDKDAMIIKGGKTRQKTPQGRKNSAATGKWGA